MRRLQRKQMLDKTRFFSLFTPPQNYFDLIRFSALKTIGQRWLFHQHHFLGGDEVVHFKTVDIDT